MQRVNQRLTKDSFPHYRSEFCYLPLKDIKLQQKKTTSIFNRLSIRDRFHANIFQNENFFQNHFPHIPVYTPHEYQLFTTKINTFFFVDNMRNFFSKRQQKKKRNVCFELPWQRSQAFPVTAGIARVPCLISLLDLAPNQSEMIIEFSSKEQNNVPLLHR